MTDDKTNDVILEMLRENTGKSILDSGGDFGRHWQRNRARDFKSEPATTIEFSAYTSHQSDKPVADISVTHNVYHWLQERVVFNPELNQRWLDWRETEEKDGQWGSDNEFVDSIGEGGKKISGIYGDGDPCEVNTYNGEDLLSQILQYVYWTDEDGEHVLLQIHGGADARGGYTDAVAFDCSETLGELAIFDNNRAGLYTDDCRTNWYFDGSVWECDDGPRLDDYEVMSFDETETSKDGEKLADMRGQGVLCIDAEGNGYCPVTGGVLQASAY